MSITLPLDELRIRGFVEDDFSDAELVQGWAFAWSFINLFTNRNFTPTDLTLKLDGCGLAELSMPMEIISISSVSEETLGALVEGTDYVVYNRRVPDDREDSKIVMINSTFPIGLQNVTVTGCFGYIDPDNTPEQPPLPLLEVAKRILPIAFENILESGERDVDVVTQKRDIYKESTDKWSYTRFNREAVENQLLDDRLMNAILQKYYKATDIIALDFV